MVNRSHGSVSLFDFRFSAEVYLSARNDQAYCTLVELVPDYGTPSSIQPNRISADRIERDRE